MQADLGSKTYLAENYGKYVPLPVQCRLYERISGILMAAWSVVWSWSEVGMFAVTAFVDVPETRSRGRSNLGSTSSRDQAAPGLFSTTSWS